MKCRYYSIMRPVAPGTYPKPEDNPVTLIHNFDEREYIPEIGRRAWGYIDYIAPLPEATAAAYELVLFIYPHRESEDSNGRVRKGA